MHEYVKSIDGSPDIVEKLAILDANQKDVSEKSYNCFCEIFLFLFLW